ncbi:MAG: ABC transporter permease subunit [Fibrobacteria bacterium]|nr:ABC transporter permease subunit [Fibrobacteria bacterium]
MIAYITRRILLMIPTILGITLVCFSLIQLVPGGPVEEMVSKLKASASLQGEDASRVITEEELENIKTYYGFDKPAVTRYFLWLGNVFRLDLGTSYSYEEPVWDVIASKFPISLFFGLVSFLLSYLICVPLGLYKAVKNHSVFDSISSAVIFTGYVIPGYALGILLIILFCGGSVFNWFPLSGIVSDNFEELSLFGRILDFMHHMVLPIICYMASEFAFLTMLMKNSLLEEIRKEYIRTALVKGSSFKTAIWRHALRNALIPIATRLSEIFTLMFAGALLIEKVFDIDGMGLLVYNSIINRDYNVVMGIILLTSVLTLMGRLFSDIMYVVIDPRIKFD